MIYASLQNKIESLKYDNIPLLWMEGSRMEQVEHIQIKGQKNLVLTLVSGTLVLVQFEKCIFTNVGIQFWRQGRIGVLYQWKVPMV